MRKVVVAVIWIGLGAMGVSWCFDAMTTVTPADCERWASEYNVINAAYTLSGSITGEDLERAVELDERLDQHCR